MKSLSQAMALLMSAASAVTLNQQSATAVDTPKHHIKTPSGDSLFAKPVESYPVENSLALTQSFIYGSTGSGRSVRMGEFEMDVLWIYIIVVVILIGAVIAGIICCCSGKKEGDEEKKEGEEEKKEGDEEEKKEGEGEEEKKEEAAAE